MELNQPQAIIQVEFVGNYPIAWEPPGESMKAAGALKDIFRRPPPSIKGPVRDEAYMYMPGDWEMLIETAQQEERHAEYIEWRATKKGKKQIKDGDGHEEQKGEQKMRVRVQKGEQKMSVRVISVDKGKGIDKGEEDKVSKLSLRGSYRKATDKFKRSRVASLFGIGEKRE
ncbi:hypothetical protein B0T24DRAFT_672844 [Lasiosphaeria ovina]|uniref:Uncharacterized protein n=1 Tax=Lasiosphaeria ovina TaxID=92902 RepID=A0AAE0NK44_9PEZI|nr:hypothetical protein B0T24DRAFT_672844 [Lasiosphaeria ovina]